MSTRRTTRRNAASTDPALSAKETATQEASAAIAEPSRKRGRKNKAMTTTQTGSQAESQAVVQSQPGASGVGSVSTTATTTATTAVPRRTTRAAKAAGIGSPLRVYQPPETKRKRTRGQTARVAAESTCPEPSQDDSSDEQGVFFTKSEQFIPSPPSTRGSLRSLSLSLCPENKVESHNDHRNLSASQSNDVLSSPHHLSSVSSLHNQNSVSLRNGDAAALAAKNQMLATKNQGLLAENKDLAAENQGLTVENQVFAAENQALAVKNQRLAVRNQDFAAKYQGFAAENQRLESENQGLVSENRGLAIQNQLLEAQVITLEAQVIELEKTNLHLVNENTHAVETCDGLLNKIESLQREAQRNYHLSPVVPVQSSAVPARPQQFYKSPFLSESNFDEDLSYCLDEDPLFTHSTPWAEANRRYSDFDTQLLSLQSTIPTQPMFANSSASAMALLQKLEDAAKEPPRRCEPSVTESCPSEPDESMMHTPQQSSTKRPYEQTSTTPARPISDPSGFFTRSFSAFKSIKSLFATPAPTASPPAEASSLTSTKTLPEPNSFTEALSAPPTPVGERKRTAARKKRTDHMMRTLLKGVDPADKHKAEEWAKQILPDLKNDSLYRAKRRYLERPMLVKDLNNFPSSKPWENGFGDPLADLDDEDIVPVWAVYLDMVADEEIHTAKRHKATDGRYKNSEDILSMKEQHAASQSPIAPPKLFDSLGHSASGFDMHPRRSTIASPMFDSSLSHHEGGNVFKELQGHDTAAQIRTNHREVLQSATKLQTLEHNPGMGSFSVPDDSSEDDSTIINEPSDTNASPATPLWTQPPPPAPVPAHAPLPGGAAIDAPSTSTAEKPVDEVERQRQKLMKHTPAKPSRLREATYPSPSLFSDVGNESVIMASPAQTAAAMTPIFDGIPTPALIELEAEEQTDLDALVSSDQYKRQIAADLWPTAIISYESDEEDLSPL